MRRWERPDLAGHRVRGGAARGWQDERGSQTVEWIGIGAVVVAIIAGIIGFVPAVGDAFADAIGTVLDQVLGG